MDSHLSDELLLSHLDDEISREDANRVQSHLEACWQCRARRRRLENAIVGFVYASEPRSRRRANFPAYFLPLCACILVAVALFQAQSRLFRHSASVSAVVSRPLSSLTPGAALLVDRRAVCATGNSNNKMVPADLRRAVLANYGIPGADPRAYEIDYLVTPALGGADDIHNLWPHSYDSTVWNAKVKDALEERLRDLVCKGELDLSTAQREIASDWIAAYKKYFRAETPSSSTQK